MLNIWIIQKFPFWSSASIRDLFVSISVALLLPEHFAQQQYKFGFEPPTPPMPQLLNNGSTNFISDSIKQHWWIPSKNLHECLILFDRKVSMNPTDSGKFTFFFPPLGECVFLLQFSFYSWESRIYWAYAPIHVNYIGIEQTGTHSW